jgi:hypothetical protein
MIHGTLGFLKIARSTGRLVNRLLRSTGVQLARTATCDLRDFVTDPIEGAYHACGSSLIITAELQHCRALSPASFACTLKAKHPGVETLLAYGHRDCHVYADSPLRSYFEVWQPANAAEALGLAPNLAHHTLRHAPAFGAVMPWDPQGPTDAWIANKIRSIGDDNRGHGAALGHKDGIKSFGPVSYKKGDLEFKRFTGVYDSIRRDGYRPTTDSADGYITGFVLAHVGHSRIVITVGQHRIAALTALGWERTPVRLRPGIVHREDVASWPNVRSGLFTHEQALEVFDRIFNGEQPAGCLWRSTCGSGLQSESPFSPSTVHQDGHDGRQVPGPAA